MVPGKCARCKRPLKDPRKVFGPDCAKRNEIEQFISAGLPIPEEPENSVYPSLSYKTLAAQYCEFITTPEAYLKLSTKQLGQRLTDSLKAGLFRKYGKAPSQSRLKLAIERMGYELKSQLKEKKRKILASQAPREFTLEDLLHPNRIQD